MEGAGCRACCTPCSLRSPCSPLHPLHPLCHPQPLHPLQPSASFASFASCYILCLLCATCSPLHPLHPIVALAPCAPLAAFASLVSFASPAACGSPCILCTPCSPWPLHNSQSGLRASPSHPPPSQVPCSDPGAPKAARSPEPHLQTTRGAPLVPCSEHAQAPLRSRIVRTSHSVSPRPPEGGQEHPLGLLSHNQHELVLGRREQEGKEDRTRACSSSSSS